MILRVDLAGGGAVYLNWARMEFTGAGVAFHTQVNPHTGTDPRNRYLSLIPAALITGLAAARPAGKGRRRPQVWRAGCPAMLQRLADKYGDPIRGLSAPPLSCFDGTEGGIADPVIEAELARGHTYTVVPKGGGD